ncbi:unnamed protein product [Parajaminaea phylloscopi]
MFGRIQNAASQADGASSHGQSRGGATRNNGGGGGGSTGRGIAGSALKRAGLMDDDVGMRSAGSAGSARRGGNGARRGVNGGGPSAAGPSRIQVDNEGGSGNKARKARDRANPLSARLNRKPGVSREPTATGHAFAIRGAASAGGATKGRGRPGGRAATGDTSAGASSSASSMSTQGTIGVLRRFMASRWNGSANFLNLDNMKADAILSENGVKPPGQAGAHKDIASVMWKLAAELYPSLVTLSLANNDFKTLTPCLTLPQHLPNIVNLSLEGNDLKWTKDLLTLSKSKFGKLTSLRELMLTGNPVQENATAAMNEEGYRAEVLAQFPSLALLDRKSVSQKETAVAQLPSTVGKGKASEQSTLGPDTPTSNFPLQVKGGFSDEAASSIVPGFLHKYFTLFDTGRESQDLRAAYASNATWTLCLNHRVPPRAISAGFLHSSELPRQKDLNWHGYKSVANHDIMSLGTRPAWKGFPIGANAIMATLVKLPQTQHPLTDATKFVVDSWILPNSSISATVGAAGANQAERPEAVLFINVKGEFAEAPSMGLRSFDRTFVVAPSHPESSAARVGWPCVILSEQLTVRHYSGHAGWKADSLPTDAQPSQMPASGPAPTPTASAAAPVTASSQEAPPPGIAPEQHSLALQFSTESGLTYPFALQCLQENAWQPQAAMGVFANLKAQGAIPAEAFMPGRAP